MAQRPQAGDAVHFLRPERLTLLAAGEAAENEVQGTITAIAYRGDRRRLVVDGVGGQGFLVTIDSRTDEIVVGAPARLGWSSGPASLFQGGRRI